MYFQSLVSKKQKRYFIIQKNLQLYVNFKDVTRISKIKHVLNINLTFSRMIAVEKKDE